MPATNLAEIANTFQVRIPTDPEDNLQRIPSFFDLALEHFYKTAPKHGFSALSSDNIYRHVQG